MTQKIYEVSPPGWGHTKAEKEKTKPEKPKSKIGGTAHAMQQAQKRGDIPKNMNIFALMWSMKNKKDKPHYKPGVKDVLKKKYKGPEGQNEEKAGEKPYPPTRLFKNVPNSVVKKANKEADKVKKEQEKAVLGVPPKNGPSGATMHSTDNVYEDSLIAQAIAELSKKTLGSYVKKAAPNLAVNYAAGVTRVSDKRKKGINTAADKLSKEDMSLAPKGKGRKAAKALYKENKVTHIGDILRQAIEEAKKVNAIDTINKIVKTKTMGKLHGQKVDLFTASAIQQVYKAINQKNKEKMNSVMSKDIHGLLKMADFSMTKMKR